MGDQPVMLWWHWAMAFSVLVGFVLWVGIKFGVDLSDILLFPLLLLGDW